MAAPRRGDLLALGSGLVLIGAAFAVGAILNARGVPIHARVAPLAGRWDPRLAPATPFAIAVAAVAIGWGPSLVRRLPWRRLLLTAYLASTGWVLALGLVDGWARLAARLAKPSEYLSEVATAPPPLELLPEFAGRIINGAPDSWTTHVSGHPPGALEFFVLLDRLGLGGGDWAAAACLLAGSSACLAVAITLRAVAGEPTARRAVPFLVLTPAALYIAVSADAFFLAVSAWGIALLAVAARSTGPRGDVAAAGAGLVLGLSLYLSYGLALLGMVALAVLVVGRRVRPGLTATAAVGTVVLAVTAAGFWWWDGYQQVVIRYYQGWGDQRPYAYWVWANLAALLICAGPAVAAGLRRVPRHRAGAGAVVIGALLAVAAASLSGLSKAEVERIWLPFALWLVPACALLPLRDHRGWLAVQAGAALLVQHLILTSW